MAKAKRRRRGKEGKWSLDNATGVHSAVVGTRMAEIKQLFRMLYVVTVSETVAESEDARHWTSNGVPEKAQGRKGELIALTLNEAEQKAEEFFKNGDFSECAEVGHSQRSYEKASSSMEFDPGKICRMAGGGQALLGPEFR